MKIGIEIDDTLHHRVRIQIARLTMTFKDAYIEAIEEWVVSRELEAQQIVTETKVEEPVLKEQESKKTKKKKPAKK